MTTHLRILRASTLIAILFCCYASLAKDNPDDKARPLLKAAAERALFHADGSSPFNVKLSFTIYGSKPKEMQGTYTWLVGDNGRWRREVTFSDYSELTIGSGTTVWIRRSLDYEPLQAVWLAAAFSNFQYLDTNDYTVGKYFTAFDHQVELRCIDLTRENRPRGLCFDPEGNLVKADLKELNLTIEYSDYRSAGRKFAPHKITLKRERKVVLEGTVDSLSTETKVDQALLEPPAGAKKRGGCPTPTLPKIVRKVPPEYPSDARHAHEEGTVTMYALIANDGTVRNPFVIQTAGRALDAASLGAVPNWQYEPAKCGDVPVDFETAISTNFSLRSW
jgi:TonB family protein